MADCLSSPMIALLIALATALGIGPARARAQGSAPENHADPGARSAFEQGRDAYDRGRFGEALSLFDRAYELSPHPLLLYNIGRAAEADLQNERAVSAYEAYLKALERAENREFVEARLAKLRQLERRRTQEIASAAPVQPLPVPRAPVVPKPLVPAATTVTSAPSTAPLRAVPRLRVHAGGHLGALGRGVFEADGYASEKSTLAPSFGLQLGVSYGWRYFAIGPELRLSFIDVPYDARRKTVDVLAKPMPGYVFSRVPLALYAAFPTGLSVPMFDDDAYQLGAVLGLMAGAMYFFSEHVGVSFETGWLVRWYGHSSRSLDAGQSANLTLREWNVANMSVVFGR